jgi:ABC-2 type transport system ATP-binding protein
VRLRDLPGVDRVEMDDETRSLTAFPRDGAHLLTAVSELAARQQWPLEQLHLESGRLDEVFRTITTGSSATGGQA